MPNEFSYDPKCEELARHFMQSDLLTDNRDAEAVIPKLAQAIQDAVEDFDLSAAYSEVRGADAR